MDDLAACGNLLNGLLNTQAGQSYVLLQFLADSYA